MTSETREEHRDKLHPVRKVLVISFSQSGQLDRIVASFTAPLQRMADVVLAEEVLRPIEPFPFPWSTYQFLDVFPESFRGTPCPLEAPSSRINERYDLIILAYQVWYLAPSIPVWSFLQSPEAERLLRHTPIVTIVACRNTWIHAHERVKERLRAVGARLIGHVVLADRTYQLVSLLTFLRWMRTGRKDRWLGIFPEPGVSEQSIGRCAAPGQVVADALRHPELPNIQERLNELSACRVIPHLMFLEERGVKLFDIWSGWIIEKGYRGDPRRGLLLRIFGWWVLLLVVLMSPLSFLLFHATFPFIRSSVKRRIERVHRF